MQESATMTEMETMKALWDRLETWALAHAGRSLALQPGVTEADIAAAEAALGLGFPADYRASLLLHDGQRDTDDVFEWLPGCSPLKPLAKLVERWREEQTLIEDDQGPGHEEGPLYTVMWHPERLPIAGTPWWDGDNTYLDLHPTPAGNPGQVITFVTECDLVCVGSSFRDALTRYVEALESGAYVWNAAKGTVTPKDDAPDEYPNRSGQWASTLGY